MKNKPITKKEIEKRGLTDKALIYVVEIAETRVSKLTDKSVMGNPVQDTSEPLKELL